MLDRVACEAVFREAVVACRPERFVQAALHGTPLSGRLVYGIALGNAAISMVRGAGPVMHGIVVTRDDDRARIPKGWAVIPDDEAAPFALLDVVAAAGAEDLVLVLLSGGAEHVVAQPVGRVELARGGLARSSAAPVRTLIASDVEGDDLAQIGGAPTFPPRRAEAAEGFALDKMDPRTRQDQLRLTIPRAMFWGGIHAELRKRHTLVEAMSVSREPATELAGRMVEACEARGYPHLWFGIAEGAGGRGRGRHLALAFARELRGRARSAFVAASTGWDDGPEVLGSPRPAGAFVDGTTWDAIARAGIDPEAALAHGDTGAALHAVGALVITHLTGLDHGGDIVMIG
jgi:glycerate 2-kinase